VVKKIVVISLSIIIILFSASCTEHMTVWNALLKNPEILEGSFESKTEFLSDEYFYELGELFELVKIGNDKWYVFDGSKKIAAKAVINKMMEDLESNPSALTNHENFNRFFETFDENIRKLDSMTEKIHFFRNTLNSYSDAPIKLDEMITLATRDKWKLFSAKYHRFNNGDNNGALNVKFISADGRFEAVYNMGTGELVVDPVNMGTYNYAPGSVNPIKYYKHNTFDKIPWKKWGNIKGVSYQDIMSLESKHGSDEAKNNTKKVERLIKQRKDELIP
jgi:hypothetical protein